MEGVASNAAQIRQDISDALDSTDVWPNVTVTQEMKAKDILSKLEAMATVRPWGDAPTNRLHEMGAEWNAAVDAALNVVSAYVASLEEGDSDEAGRQLDVASTELKTFTYHLGNAETEVEQVTDELLSGEAPDEPTQSPTPTLTAAQERAKYKASCKRIAFKLLNRDADMLVGKKYRLTGQVMQIRDAGSGNVWTGFPGGVEPRTQMLVSVTRDEWGYWDDNVAVVYDGRLAKVFEDDVIKVWGECLGQYTYESVAGYTITVPLVHAKYVSK